MTEQPQSEPDTGDEPEAVLDEVIKGELEALACEEALRRKPRAVPTPLRDFLR